MYFNFMISHQKKVCHHYFTGLQVACQPLQFIELRVYPLHTIYELTQLFFINTALFILPLKKGVPLRQWGKGAIKSTPPQYC